VVAVGWRRVVSGCGVLAEGCEWWRWVGGGWRKVIGCVGGLAVGCELCRWVG
jgi:hypothetical protein